MYFDVVKEDNLRQSEIGRKLIKDVKRKSTNKKWNKVMKYSIQCVGLCYIDKRTHARLHNISPDHICNSLNPVDRPLFLAEV